MKWLTRQSRRNVQVRSRRRSLLLRLEALEDRCVPAVHPVVNLVENSADLAQLMSESGSHADDHAAFRYRTSRVDYIDGQAHELIWDPAPNAGDGAGGGAGSGSSSALNPLTSIPILNSLPGATDSLYLDFNGHFDATWGSYSNVTTPVFDQDNDLTTFSDGELETIRNIWTIVAEDYAPFKINVTTVQPASFANGVAMRVAIGGDGAWSGGTYGGIAYIGSFTNSIVNTVYVFPKNLGYAKYIGEASSHEAGHSFGLQHQSEYDSSGVKINDSTSKFDKLV